MKKFLSLYIRFIVIIFDIVWFLPMVIRDIFESENWFEIASSICFAITLLFIMIPVSFSVFLDKLKECIKEEEGENIGNNSNK